MRTRYHNSSKFAMDERVVYGLFALLTKTIPVDKNKSPSPKIVDCKDFTQGCHPSEESNTRWSPLKIVDRKDFIQGYRPSKESNMKWGLHLPNALSRKKRRLQIVMCCRSFSLQTCDYGLGTVTFYLSHSEKCSKSIKDRGM